MIFKKTINRLATLCLLTVFTASSWALPLTFEFTGTISDTVLVSAIYQPTSLNRPEWNGQKVSGILIMDLPELAASPYNGPGFTQYAKTEDDYDYADWMSFSITNPDGTVIDVSDSIPLTPSPEAEGDDALTYLAHLSYLHDDSAFYAQRTYNNYDTPARNSASLSLRTFGENAYLLTSSADYNDVIIRPEFANEENYGSVYQVDSLGIGYDYSFRIDSLVRVTSEVPEPSGLILSSLAFLLIGWRLHQSSKLKK